MDLIRIDNRNFRPAVMYKYDPAEAKLRTDLFHGRKRLMAVFFSYCGTNLYRAIVVKANGDEEAVRKARLVLDFAPYCDIEERHCRGDFVPRAIAWVGTNLYDAD